ncbi:olfactory receptor 5AR1-like [Hyperolius riggenbachi]|uniref:olfactory receptor 5AR1-like n=1 Tax=Hyperolius riggenbachi TaxID=752182 RepID=UPI0035A335BF
MTLNPMRMENKTSVRVFVFSGLTDDSSLVPFLFIFFLLVYMVTVVGNVGMMIAVRTLSSLHSPMYYFLSYLSMVDLCLSSAVTPKMLCDLWSDMKSISFHCCALQLFFFAGLAVTESLVLSGMSYDRYVAICHPLYYITIMTKTKCLVLLLLASSIGLLQAFIQTTCIFSLEYCRMNIIDHYYCDIPPLLKLSCSRTLPCYILSVISMSLCGVGAMLMVFVSYTLIVTSILQMKSMEGRKKAFSTCSSHMLCVAIFYGTSCFVYLRPPSTVFEKQDQVVSIIYTVMIPMVNPLIYSLRNREVKKAVKEALCRFQL